MKAARIIFAVLIIALSIGIIYCKSYDNPEFFDSFLHLEWYGNQQSNFSISAIVHELKNGNALGRTLSAATFEWLLDFGLVGQNLANIILHGCCSVLLLLVLIQFFDFSVAAVIALLFAISPTAMFAVNYLVQRSIILVMFFGLLQTLLISLAIKSRNIVTAIAMTVASIAAFLLACISKEHGVVFASMYLLFPIMGRLKKQLTKTLCIFLFLCGFGALWYIAKNKIALGANIDEHYTQILLAGGCVSKAGLFFKSFASQCSNFFNYMLHWLVPILPSSIDIQIPLVSGAYAYVAIAALLQYIAWSIWFILRPKTRLLGAGMFLAFAFFTPELSRLRIGETFVLYRSYIYALPYAFIAGWILTFLKDCNRMLFVTITAILVIMSSAHAFLLSKTFESPAAVWQHAAAMIDLSDPESACRGARAFNNAGFHALVEGRARQATEYLKKSCELNDKWDSPFSNLGIAYLLSGEKEKAEIVLTNLAATSKDQEKVIQAKYFLEKIRALKPTPAASK